RTDRRHAARDPPRGHRAPAVRAPPRAQPVPAPARRAVPHAPAGRRRRRRAVRRPALRRTAPGDGRPRRHPPPVPVRPPGGDAMSATDILLWGVLPYVVTAVFVVGHVWRYRYDQFGWTT